MSTSCAAALSARSCSSRKCSSVNATTPMIAKTTPIEAAEGAKRRQTDAQANAHARVRAPRPGGEPRQGRPNRRLPAQRSRRPLRTNVPVCRACTRHRPSQTSTQSILGQPPPARITRIRILVRIFVQTLDIKIVTQGWRQWGASPLTGSPWRGAIARRNHPARRLKRGARKGPWRPPPLAEAPGHDVAHIRRQRGLGGNTPQHRFGLSRRFPSSDRHDRIAVNSRAAI